MLNNMPLYYFTIAITCLLVGLVSGAYLGYLVASLKKDNEQLKARIAELETNGEYPKRRTHADIRRIEDEIAETDRLWSDVELLILHHEQDARLERERLNDIETKIKRLSTRLGETRNSRPDQYPEYK